MIVIFISLLFITIQNKIIVINCTINDYFSSLSESGSEDLLSHNDNIYRNLRNLSTLTQKLCHCNENGTFCSYRHHQNCKTATWGTKYACVLQASSRKKREIRLPQQAHSSDKVYNLTQVECE